MYPIPLLMHWSQLRPSKTDCHVSWLLWRGHLQEYSWVSWHWQADEPRTMLKMRPSVLARKPKLQSFMFPSKDPPYLHPTCHPPPNKKHHHSIKRTFFPYTIKLVLILTMENRVFCHFFLCCCAFKKNKIKKEDPNSAQLTIRSEKNRCDLGVL